MRALVTCVKRSGPSSENRYSLLYMDGDVPKAEAMTSKVSLETGEVLDLESAGNEITSAKQADEPKFAGSLEKKCDTLTGELVSKKAYASGRPALDDITAKMWPLIRSSAEVLLKKILYGAPMIVRFHNDADGSSGAYALYLALSDLASKSGVSSGNIVWLMHRGVYYSKEDALHDKLIANSYACVEKPLLLVTDFGTAAESNAGLAELKGRFDVVWLDHHPQVELFAGKDMDHYVNPWQHGGDSNYTAGYLTCALSHSFSNIDTSCIEDASFIGDYSVHATAGECGRRMSALLDLMTSDVKIVKGATGSNITPVEIDAVLSDKERSDELFAYAEMRVTEALDNALRSVKIYNAGSAEVHVLDFKSIRSEESPYYPLPGRFASKLLDKVEALSAKPCVVVLHFGKYISIRVNKKLGASLGLLRIIEELRTGYESIDSGGGHGSAASIKLKDETEKEQILKSVVGSLKAALAA